jgi:hypothetical protein
LAAVPRPIGIDRTLVDIATGIGMSARLLPGLSMSETGAVAVKSAKVRIEFAMARATSNKSDTVELGVRTFAIAARQSSAEFSNKASNNGVIELEIVAIAAIEDRAAGVEPVRPEPVTVSQPLSTRRPTMTRSKSSARRLSARSNCLPFLQPALRWTTPIAGFSMTFSARQRPRLSKAIWIPRRAGCRKSRSCWTGPQGKRHRARGQQRQAAVSPRREPAGRANPRWPS